MWNGNSTVKPLDADDALNTMLLEHAIPVSCLATSPSTPDVVLTGLLKRPRQRSVSPRSFPHLSQMSLAWRAESLLPHGLPPQHTDAASHGARLPGGSNGRALRAGRLDWVRCIALVESPSGVSTER